MYVFFWSLLSKLKWHFNLKACLWTICFFMIIHPHKKTWRKHERRMVHEDGLIVFSSKICKIWSQYTGMSMEVSKWLVSWFITYLGDLQPTYIQVIIHLLTSTDTLVRSKFQRFEVHRLWESLEILPTPSHLHGCPARNTERLRQELPAEKKSWMYCYQRTLWEIPLKKTVVIIPKNP